MKTGCPRSSASPFFSRHPAFFVLLLLVGFGAFSAARATDYTVNALSDSKPTLGGNGSGTAGDLRYCITQANYGARGTTHTITFAVTGTITLAAHELVINSNLTITGPSKGSGSNYLLTVSGNYASRIVYIAPANTVSISGVALKQGNGVGNDSSGFDRGGNYFDTYGGAIMNNQSILTVTDCLFTENKPSPGTGFFTGAAIYSRAWDADATLNIRYCTISGNGVGDNYGDGGGGIFNWSFNGAATLNIEYTTISDNASAGDGGGIMNQGGPSAKLTIKNCAITGNVSNGYDGGGGICSRSGGSGNQALVTITDSVISGNRLTGNARAGGAGILLGGDSGGLIDSLTLDGCTIRENVSKTFGGGISNYAWLKRINVSINRCTIEGNSALTSGGGIYNYASQGTGTLTVCNSTICRNVSQRRGGGIYNFTDSNVRDSATVVAVATTICGNEALSGGAGIANEQPQASVKAAVVSLTNTILALHPVGANYNAAFADAVSGGNNLFDDATGAAFLSGSGDQNSTSAGFVVDGAGKPLLADNGGRTRTVALAAGSAAIGRGKAVNDPATGLPVVTDQRGFPRPLGPVNLVGGDGSDIGAFESGGGPTISVSAEPSIAGTVSGGGMLEAGLDGTVHAVANVGYVFVNWTEGETVVSSAADYLFHVTNARVLVAHFRPATIAALVMKGPANTTLTSGSGTIDFGIKASGTPTDLSFTIQNTGELDLTVSGVTIGGDQAGDFVVKTSPANTVLGGGSTSFTVTFTPSALGDRHAVIQVNSNDATTPSFSIALLGKGASPAAIEVALGSTGLASGVGTVDFSLMPPGHSFVRAFTIRNAGDLGLTLGALTIGGGNATDFVVTASPASTVGGGLSTTFSIKFTPGSTGLRTAVLQIPSNDAGTPFVISLKGTGAPALSFFKGAYKGLTEVSPDNALGGTVSVTVDAKGMATVALKFGGKSYSLKGQLDDFGNFTKTLPKSSLELRLKLDLENAAGEFSGTILSGAAVLAELSAIRIPTGLTAKQPSQFAGKYTVALPSDPSHPEPAYPQGTGCLTGTVSAAGVASFTGVAGDLTTIAPRAAVTSEGEFPVYIPLYGGKGSLSGWLTLNRNNSGSNVAGTLKWIKPKAKTKTYPEGFSGETSALGSIYTVPDKTSVLDAVSGQLEFRAAGGNLATVGVKTLTIDSGNKIAIVGTEKFTMKLTATSGAFAGKFSDAGKTLRTFRGVILEHQNVGLGLFLGNGETGTISVSPLP